MSELDAQLRNLGSGAHMGLIYERPEERQAVAASFVAEGFRRGEAVVLLGDERAAGETALSLTGAGLDVRLQLERGALSFVTERELFLREGAFDPEKSLGLYLKLTARVLAEGFSGLRIAADTRWVLGEDCGLEQIKEHEARINELLPCSRTSVLCAYERQARPEIIREVMRTHPVVIAGGEACENLFYEKPGMVLGDRSVDERNEWMLGQVRRFHSAERRLRAAVRTRDEFLSVASHELKTPLTALQLSLEAIERASAKHEGLRLAPALAERFDKALSHSRRLGGLIETLLDLSRLFGDRVASDRERIDLASVVRECAERFREHTSSSIRVVAPVAIVGPWGRTGIDQAVNNLVSNAVKYGQGRDVELALYEQGPDAVLIVRDHGIGISPEDQERIFQRFERAVSSRHYGGLGLGLWIAAGAVRAMGGSIEVESAPGQGSAFTVKLPRERKGAGQGELCQAAAGGEDGLFGEP